MTIHKYVLDANKDVNQVTMPGGAIIVHVHEQNNEPCLWAIVDTSMTTVRRHRFVVVGTGREIDAEAYANGSLVYRGTAHLDGGRVIAHVLEALWRPLGDQGSRS